MNSGCLQRLLLICCIVLVIAQEADDPVRQPFQDPTLAVRMRECKANPQSNRKWIVVSKWSPCSKTCGGGTQTREIKCSCANFPSVGLKIGSIPENECVSAPPNLTSRLCNTKPCPHWEVLDWDVCPACGPASHRRAVVCVGPDGSVESPHACSPPRPESEKECDVPDCEEDVFWSVNNWSSCSSSCGGGTQTRTVTCMTSKAPLRTTRLAEEICSRILTPKPASSRTCNTTPCPESSNRWKAGSWSPCSKPCNGGLSHRKVRCVNTEQKTINSSQCMQAYKPKDSAACNQLPCEWTPLPLLKCEPAAGPVNSLNPSTSSCQGLRLRDFVCINPNNWQNPKGPVDPKLASSLCGAKPRGAEPCNLCKQNRNGAA